MVRKSLAEDDEEVCCAPRFVDKVRSCPNFDNKKFNEAAIVMGFPGEDEEEDGLRMSGAFDFSMDFDDQYEIELTVQKLTNLGKEYMYSAGVNLCACLKDKDAPWAPIVQGINITGCPVYKGIYPMKEVIVKLDFYRSMMKHEFCGEYELEFTLFHTLSLEKIICLIVNIEIYEKAQK